MIELDPSLLHDTITSTDGYNPLTGEGKGVILIDDREFGLQSCGELVQSGIAAGDVVELGEVIALRRVDLTTVEEERVEKVNRFVSEGFVVYKSVGVSLTDLTVGDAILGLYKKKQETLLNSSS